MFLLVLLMSFLTPCMVLAEETKHIIAEAKYVMGDGETPAIAETMVLQQAKRNALEQAGTYVESYSKVENMNLTVDEIHTIAGGTIKINVLERNREFINNTSIQFYIKINAEVSLANVIELTGKIKGNKIANEYAKLQDEYKVLREELEKAKRDINRVSTLKEKNMLIKKIKESESKFIDFNEKEDVLINKIISAEKIVAAYDLNKKNKLDMDYYINKIISDGIYVEIGEPIIETYNKRKDYITIPVAMTGKAEIFKKAIADLGGQAIPNKRGRSGDLFQVGKEYKSILRFQSEIGNLTLKLSLSNNKKTLSECSINQRKIIKWINKVKERKNKKYNTYTNDSIFYSYNYPFFPIAATRKPITSLGIWHLSNVELPSRNEFKIDEHGFVYVSSIHTLYFNMQFLMPRNKIQEVESIEAVIIKDTRNYSDCEISFNPNISNN